jgi:deoxyribonuclease-4
LRFGFHISIAQGFSRVIENAQKTHCETIQVFSRNPRGWRHKAISTSEAKQFRENLAASDIAPCFIHLPYLPNLASVQEELYRKSIDSLCEELRRADLLHIPFLIIHVGNRGSLCEEEAITRVVKGINTSLHTVDNQVMILLENTAGQGTEIGFNFTQLKKMFSAVEDKGRIGICLDTAHAFAAGYDFSSKKGLDAVLSEFDRLIGLQHLHLLHLNDAKTPFGSRADRHWHIGEGYIGSQGFKHIVNHPLLDHLPGIMETPRKDLTDDLRNMRVIRGLVKKEG